MFEFDELQIYRGRDIQITPKITITIPTIGEIEEFGERQYFSAVQTFTAVGADLKWQLWDFYNIDYTQIEDYELFITYISQALSSKKHIYNELMNNKEQYADQLANLSQEDLDEMLVNPLQLVLRDIDLADFEPYNDEAKKQIILYDKEHDITIDKYVYTMMVTCIRQIHGFKRNNQRPANKRTKMALIEDARDEALLASRKPKKSVLKPLVSATTVKCGMCGDDKIWDMKISAFFDNIKRMSKIQEAELLLQGAYSGFASLKGVDKSRLDWAGDI